MAVSSFFDGSGSLHDPSSSILTLAGVGMREAQIPEFEALWRHDVTEAFEIPHVHMTDLMAYPPRKEFAGWREQKKEELVTAAFNVMGQFSSSSLHGMACSVVKEDYEKCMAKHPRLYAPESICVNYCVSQTGVDDDGSLILYFDHGEPFMNKIYRVWTRLRNQPHGWPSQIKEIYPADPDKALLQVADMLAWVVRKQHEPGGLPSDWRRLGFTFHLAPTYVERLYDFRRLAQEADGGIIVRKSE